MLVCEVYVYKLTHSFSRFSVSMEKDCLPQRLVEAIICCCGLRRKQDSFQGSLDTMIPGSSSFLPVSKRLRFFFRLLLRAEGSSVATVKTRLKGGSGQPLRRVSSRSGSLPKIQVLLAELRLGSWVYANRYRLFRALVYFFM